MINGALYGGFGPDLHSLLPSFPTEAEISPGVFAPITGVFAPGFINNPAFTYVPAAFGAGALVGPGPSVTLLPPSTTTLLKNAVEFAFSGELPPGLPTSASTVKAANTQTLGISQAKGVDLGTADGPALLPKQQPPQVTLGISQAKGVDLGTADGPALLPSKKTPAAIRSS